MLVQELDAHLYNTVDTAIKARQAFRSPGSSDDIKADYHFAYNNLASAVGAPTLADMSTLADGDWPTPEDQRLERQLLRRGPLPNMPSTTRLHGD